MVLTIWKLKTCCLLMLPVPFFFFFFVEISWVHFFRTVREYIQVLLIRSSCDWTMKIIFILWLSFHRIIWRNPPGVFIAIIICFATTYSFPTFYSLLSLFPLSFYHFAFEDGFPFSFLNFFPVFFLILSLFPSYFIFLYPSCMFFFKKTFFFYIHFLFLSFTSFIY